MAGFAKKGNKQNNSGCSRKSKMWYAKHLAKRFAKSVLSEIQHGHGQWTRTRTGLYMGKHERGHFHVHIYVRIRAGHALFFTLRACALFGGAPRLGAFALLFGPLIMRIYIRAFALLRSLIFRALFLRSSIFRYLFPRSSIVRALFLAPQFFALVHLRSLFSRS